MDITRFNADVEEKNNLKDTTLEIPYDIDYVKIAFQDQFVINKYFQDYYNDFGLEATAFYDFAKKGLFAVVDRDKFQTFITNVNNFILHALDNNQNVKYSNYVKYISGFKLLKTNDILKVRLENIGEFVYLSLIDLPLDEAVKQELVQSLIAYIESSGIAYKYDVENDRIELQNPTPEQIQKIIQNFDIIESVTSSAFTTIRPSEFNTVQRQFGFDIQNADEDLPIVGIIDTGIAQQTALAPLIIDDTTFTIAGSPLIDQAGRNR